MTHLVWLWYIFILCQEILIYCHNPNCYNLCECGVICLRIIFLLCFRKPYVSHSIAPRQCNSTSIFQPSEKAQALYSKMKSFMDKYVYPAEQVIILADNSIKIIPWPHRFFLKFFPVWERMSHVKQQKRVAKVQDNQGVFSSSPHCNVFSLLCSLFIQNDAEKNFKKNLLTRVIKCFRQRKLYLSTIQLLEILGKKIGNLKHYSSLGLLWACKQSWNTVEHPSFNGGIKGTYSIF